jgi:molecular chaperone DnaK (HSP70)
MVGGVVVEDGAFSLGVDIGTTFTAAALWRAGRVETVPLEDYAKPSLKKYKPTAARNEDKKVFSGLL